MRLPRLDRDFWQLTSGESRNAAAPDSFPIPTLEERSSLEPGQAAKLIFEVEANEPDGRVTTSTERMWVVITERTSDGYIGILDNEPCSYAASDDFYLGRGVEIPFLPMHVISIELPPEAYVAELRKSGAKRKWDRNEA